MDNLSDTQRSYAGFWVRLGSFFADYTIFATVFAAFSALFAAIIHPLFKPEIFMQVFLFCISPFGLVMAFSYYTFFNANGRQTLGKRIFGLQVLNYEKKPLTLMQSFYRSLLFIFDTLIFCLGHLFILLPAKRKALRDVIFKSDVIRIKPKHRLEVLFIVLFVVGCRIPSLPFVKYLRADHLQSYRIPTGGMKSTVLIGDFLLVDKYWPKRHKPVQGDIIVFKYPLNENIDYIKRVIAGPGQKVQIQEGTVYIDDKPEGEQSVLHKKFDSEEGQYVIDYKLTTPSGKTYQIRRYERLNPAKEFIPVVMANNHYFVLGDNRDNSADSRSWGLVPEKNVTGIAGLVYFSWDKQEPFYLFHKAIRWSRLGKILN